MSEEARPGALQGVRVLDLSRVLAGPWCSQNLADLGAEVIKIERPQGGDDTRSWGPPYMKAADGSDSSESTYYLCCNRGKKSVTVDIATASGQRFLRELAADCDVVIENFKVSQLKRYGLDYANLKEHAPSLIYCSITGFGQDGPWSDRPGYDFIAQGLSGFMSITGEHESVPNSSPQKAGAGIADIFAGMYATMAVLAALHHRQRTGEGQYIDVSLLDCMIAAMSNHNTCYLNAGKVSQRLGNAHQNIVPYQTFATLDGHVIIGVGNDAQFRKFCSVAGCPHWADDPRYALNADRVKRRDELIPQVEAIVRTRTKSQWIEQLEAAGVPCAPINRVDEVFTNPQVIARGLQIDLPHRDGPVHLVGCPVRMSATPAHYRHAPPLLGEHNHEFPTRPDGQSEG